MRYFDPLYGQIELDGIIAEILDSCWEVRRLKHVGLMNFRSLSMHAFTHATRLEHALGTAYLAQRLASARRFDARAARTLIAAALLHDISCRPFGHSVEWALIAKGTAEDHERSSRWTLERRLAAAETSRPLFLDSEPFDPARFDLDLEFFRKLHAGQPGSTYIASDYMDLDNLDNVFRMGLYLGLERASRDRLLRLVDNLALAPNATCFSLPEAVLPDALLWQDLRHEIYNLFIYDPSYLSFEGQIFELIFALLDKVADPFDKLHLGDFPDDVLLWQYFLDDGFLELKPLLRRLIALDSYCPVYVARVEDRRLCNSLPSAVAHRELNSLLVRSVRSVLHDAAQEVFTGSMKRWKTVAERDELPTGIHLHITTDKKKTSRALVVDLITPPGEHREVTIGEDRFYVVVAIMSETKLGGREREMLIIAAQRALEEWAKKRPEHIFPQSTEDEAQLSLTL